MINLSAEKTYQLCGNTIELQGSKGRILALSTTAYNALSNEQRKILEKSTNLMSLEVSAIESAGGSVRCMLAGVNLLLRKASNTRKTPIPYWRTFVLPNLALVAFS